MRWLLSIFVTLLWIMLTARIVAAIDRYSPFLSWQTAVVFGGAFVVFLVTFYKTKAL